MLVAAGDIWITELTMLANMMYVQGNFSSELNKSICIAIPKVNVTVKCEKHCTISLTSHVTKLVPRIVINRISGRTLHEIAPEQYCFMSDKGKGNAIFVLRMLVKRSIGKQKYVYVCLFDYIKAFDTVKHNLLVDLLQSLDVDQAELQLLISLYLNQTDSHQCVHPHQTKSTTMVCGFSTFIRLIYRNDYERIRGHGKFQKW